MTQKHGQIILMKFMQNLQSKRLKSKHQGGNKWIGTGGTSPFGAYGYNPEGIRIGQKESRNKKAVKVWDKREFSNLDGDVELGTRNIKVVKTKKTVKAKKIISKKSKKIIKKILPKKTKIKKKCESCRDGN